MTVHEFWRFIGILISASSYKKGGNNIWDTGGDGSCHTMCPPINYGPTGMNLMPLYRFVILRKAFAHAFHDKDSNSDWAQIGLLINGYNSNRKKNIAASFRKVFDESMSAIVPRTSPTGGLPTISFIIRKPEPLGTEVKVSFKQNQLYLSNIIRFHLTTIFERLFVVPLQESSCILKFKKVKI